MCAYIFGATSSPSSANFTLRKAADDHKAKLGEKAASYSSETFTQMTSFENSKDAIDTIPKVFRMTDDGGFRISVDYS